jgi:hypothetical protein
MEVVSRQVLKQTRFGAFGFVKLNSAVADPKAAYLTTITAGLEFSVTSSLARGAPPKSSKSFVLSATSASFVRLNYL